jgi:hypothetical protein
MYCTSFAVSLSAGFSAPNLIIFILFVIFVVLFVVLLEFILVDTGMSVFILD